MGNRLTLWKTKAITDLRHAESKVIWRPPATGPYSREIWAPEIHRINGKWYFYFAADDGKNENHRMYVLENASADPMQGTWEFKGQLKDLHNKWAIDGTVFQHKDKLYFLWSGWDGDINGRQDIYISPMSNAWTISGPRVLLSKPTLDWEMNGDPDVNEGPQILTNQDKLFLVYSASGCWTDFYTLGMLTASANSDILDPASWQKLPQPVFSQSPPDSVFGTGHNSFFQSPDGTETWILYHANAKPGQGCGGFRTPRAQKMTWNADGTPNFGKPIATKVPLTRPAGEQDNPIAFYYATQDAAFGGTGQSGVNTRQLRLAPDQEYIMLQFKIDNAKNKKIKSVKLKLTEGAAPAGDIAFKVITGNPLWQEQNLGWTKKPYRVKKLGEVPAGQLTEGQRLEIPLKKSVIRKNGFYNLALIPSSGSTTSEFYSTETGDGPQLIIEYR